MKTCPTCRSSYPDVFRVCPQDGASLLAWSEWSEGTVIREKYRILEKLGQGGMGVVYKALHVVFNELRVLKVMHPELLGDELFLKRFEQEAIITRKLLHPNAVRVEDIDKADDSRPFIVMEYIEGKSLKRVIRQEGPQPVPRVCTIAKQVASALEAAHQLGMIHRDIKPDNIVLIQTPEGEQAKVLDFGIAKLKEARATPSAGMTLTGAGVVVGTPQYMSPEQAMGKRGDELDGRSDLYSLGVVMYQMLTGDPPFKADSTMQMIIAHIHTPPTPIRQARPDLQIPEAVASLVMRCLEKKPDLRPPSAKALIEEIERIENERPQLAGTVVPGAPPLVSPQAEQQEAEAERLAREIAERERLARERAEAVRLAAERAGAVREALQKAERERLAREEAEAERLAAGRARAERAAQRKAEQERLAREKVEAEPRAREAVTPVTVTPRQWRHGLWLLSAILLVGIGLGVWRFTHQPLSTSPPEAPQTTAPAPVGPPPSDAAATKPSSTPPPEASQTTAPTPISPPLSSATATKPSSIPPPKTPRATGPAPLRPQPSKATTTKPSTAAVNPATAPSSPTVVPGPPTPDGATPGSKGETGADRSLPKPIEPDSGETSPKTAPARESPLPKTPVDPKKVAATVAMGNFYYERGDLDSAIAEYQKGLAMDPSNNDLRTKLERARTARDALKRLRK